MWSRDLIVNLFLSAYFMTTATRSIVCCCGIYTKYSLSLQVWHKLWSYWGIISPVGFAISTKVANMLEEICLMLDYLQLLCSTLFAYDLAYPL